MGSRRQRRHPCARGVAPKVRNPLSGEPDAELSARDSLPRLPSGMSRSLRCPATWLAFFASLSRMAMQSHVFLARKPLATAMRDFCKT